MNTNKNFYIYVRGKGFYNFNRLNDIGQKVMAFLNYLYTNKNPYFQYIRNIYVTSQDRPNDTEKSAHYWGKAIDIIINPPVYMPYVLGVMSACLNYNLYLGTVNKDQKKNLHIHIDNYFEIRKNSKYIESPNGKLYSITGKNINYILTLYGFSTQNYIQDLLLNFGNFKSETEKYLLNSYPVNQKLSFSEVTPYNIINPVQSAFSDIKKYGMLTVLGLTGIILFIKLSKKRSN